MRAPGRWTVLAWCFVLLSILAFDGFGAFYRTVVTLGNGPIRLPLITPRTLNYGSMCVAAVLFSLVSRVGRRRKPRVADPAIDANLGPAILLILLVMARAGIQALSILISVVRGDSTPDRDGWFYLGAMLALVVLLLMLFLFLFVRALVSFAAEQGRRIAVPPQLEIHSGSIAAIILWVLVCGLLLLAFGPIEILCVMFISLTLSNSAHASPERWTRLHTISLSLTGLLFLACTAFARARPSSMQYSILVTMVASGLAILDIAFRAPGAMVDFARLRKVGRIIGRPHHEVMVWAVALLAVAVAIFGMISRPGDQDWPLMLAVGLAILLLPTSDPSLSTAFFVVPRWTLWLLMIANSGTGAIAIILLCESVFLLPRLSIRAVLSRSGD